MACRPGRDLVYLNDLRGTAEYQAYLANQTVLRIQPDDLLGITVSSLSPESSILFNNGVLAGSSSANPTEATTVNNALDSKRALEGYLVDKEGNIQFPVLGSVKLGGLTREEAVRKLTADIRKYLKNPLVDLRLLNFRVTVIGEVSQPTSINVPRERINVLEALGLAGDMTPFGRRENVLVIRETEGVRTAARLNLNRKDVLDSPYFYLKQNDIVYIEPDNRARLAQNDPNNRFIPLWAAIITTLGFALITFTR